MDPIETLTTPHLSGINLEYNFYDRVVMIIPDKLWDTLLFGISLADKKKIFYETHTTDVWIWDDNRYRHPQAVAVGDDIGNHVYADWGNGLMKIPTAEIASASQARRYLDKTSICGTGKILLPEYIYNAIIKGTMISDGLLRELLRASYRGEIYSLNEGKNYIHAKFLFSLIENDERIYMFESSSSMIKATIDDLGILVR